VQQKHLWFLAGVGVGVFIVPRVLAMVSKKA
jgi:hypothetical protein